MAIDTYIRATIDPGSASRVDRVDHVHIITRNTSAGGDLTLAFDKAKVASKNQMRSALAQIMRALDGGTELT